MRLLTCHGSNCFFGSGRSRNSFSELFGAAVPRVGYLLGLELVKLTPVLLDVWAVYPEAAEMVTRASSGCDKFANRAFLSS
jgi:hypothetical protein